MNIRKDKAYYYYRLLKKGLTVIQIFNNYKENKSKYGRKKKVFSQEKSTEINELFDMVNEGLFDESKLRRKGKRKKNYQKEIRGKINDCKTIHERNEKYPEAKSNIEFGHFEGDIIVGKENQQ